MCEYVSLKGRERKGKSRQRHNEWQSLLPTETRPVSLREVVFRFLPFYIIDIINACSSLKELHISIYIKIKVTNYHSHCFISLLSVWKQHSN